MSPYWLSPMNNTNGVYVQTAVKGSDLTKCRTIQTKKQRTDL